MMTSEFIYPRDRAPQMGLLIHTSAGVPYVHLQLESWSRHGQDIPVLVVDEGSDQKRRLEVLCAAYGAAFHALKPSRPPLIADLESLIIGFQWAQLNQMELLVKFPSRWIPIMDWEPGLAEAALESQAATFFAFDRFRGCQIRHAASAFHVGSWLRSAALEELRVHVDVGALTVPESQLYRSARHVYGDRCDANRRYEEMGSKPLRADCFYPWSFGDEEADGIQTNVLWHEWAKPREYLRALRQWEIEDYQHADLELPAATLVN